MEKLFINHTILYTAHRKTAIHFLYFIDWKLENKHVDLGSRAFNPFYSTGAVSLKNVPAVSKTMTIPFVLI